MKYSAGVALAASVVVTGLFTGSALAADNDASGHPGDITVNESVTIDASPEEVWSTVRDFDAISLWHPAVEASDIVKGENNKPGARRHLTLGDGGTITEELLDWNDDGMQYSYRIVKGVLPVSDYRSTIAVEAEGDEQSRMIWKGNFNAAEGHTDAEAKKVLTHVYDAGLNNVKTMMGGDDDMSSDE